jgi:hypothetical protein
MAVEIKSGNSSDLGTIDPISKALRVTTYNSQGVEGTKEVPVAIACFNVTSVNNDIIPSIDVSDYKSISVQLTGSWAGAITFQGSNDNGTFYNIVAQDVTSLVTPYSATATQNSLYNVPIVYRYFRARVTQLTSGTVSCDSYGHREDKNLNSVGQIGEVNLASETTKVIGTVNVAAQETFITGVISAADTAVLAPAGDGVMRTGTPSVGSTIVVSTVVADSGWAVDLTGTLGGATFHFEGTASSTNGVDGNWTTINGRKTGGYSTVLATSTTTAGFFRGNVSGMNYFRVRATGGIGITANITIRIGQSSGAVFLNASIPAGDNVIGGIDNVQKLGGQTVAMGGGVVTSGTQRVTVATDTPVVLGEGSSIIGKVSLAGNAVLTPLFVLGQTGGSVNINSASVTSSPSILRAIVFTNYAATPRHFKLYNTASTPVAGAGTPVLVCSMPAAGTLAFPLPVEGFPFSNGIGYTMTLGAANNDATPPTTAPDFSVSMIYSA